MGRMIGSSSISFDKPPFIIEGASIVGQKEGDGPLGKLFDVVEQDPMLGQETWEDLPREITGLKVGIVGLGKSGGMIADALKFFGADISYYARSEKEAAAAKGYRFLPLRELLAESEVICCCLNKNTVLLHEEEFKQMGNRKILFNTGLSPAWDEAAFTEWLEGDNLCFCDTIGALGGEQLLNHPHVRCMQVSTGRTRQAFDRLSAKVLANLSEYNG